MTDINSRAHRMPRGRQTIRKSGSLLGFHGPPSRRIKLWTLEPKSSGTVAQLERIYFAALAAVDQFEERINKTAADSKLTPQGVKADARQFALNHLLPELHRGRESISRAKSVLGDRKANLASRHDGEIDELEDAIAAAESAVDAACEELKVEAGV
jgi:hypothetical protein